MKSAPACSKCFTPLPAEWLNAAEFRPCPRCQSPVRAEVYPAFFREATRGSAGEALVIDSEASCFYHPQKRAAVVCAQCGRYLCALCDLELDGAHYCSSCLQAGSQKGKIASVENRRMLYDSLAFHLALVGLVIFYFSPFTSPMAIYFAHKHRKTPSSIVRGASSWRRHAAILLASLQILGWLTLIGFLLTR